MTTFLLAVLVFVSAVGIDWTGTKYVLAVGQGERHRAAAWSVCQWMAGLVGFLVAIKVTLWLLPVEAFGLYLGTWLSMRGASAKVTVSDVTN